MTTNISPEIVQSIQQHLTEIEQAHDVTIIQVIESGSRAWGFPSPDSDYDVRFVYAHPKDWYVQLEPRRDVIELPISDELDIAGWDLRKTFNLANKGNAVVHEWIQSPIVYRQHDCFAGMKNLVARSFNSAAAFHHYRSMAKKAYADIQQSQNKKLKRFLYFARATLSAQWIAKEKTVPSIEFDALVEKLTDPDMTQRIRELVARKSRETESAVVDIDPTVNSLFVDMYTRLEGVDDFVHRHEPVRSDDLVGLLSHIESS